MEPVKIKLQHQENPVMGKFQICKSFYDTETGELLKDKTPQIEEVTINSQEELTSLIEKIGKENMQDKASAISMKYAMYTERKLIKL